MSTWLFLECRDHEPPLRSEDVGQQRYALTRIRHELERREVKDLNVVTGYFEGNSARFLSEHPRCQLAIVDEYGNYYATTGDSLAPVEGDQP